MLEPVLRKCLLLRLRVAVAVPLVAELASPQIVLAGPSSTDEAQRLYREGEARFQTLDYEGAIDLWTEAYSKVPATAKNREIRNSLVYNIAEAQQRAFEIDQDVRHLRQAKGLLSQYLVEYKAMYEPNDKSIAEVKKVEEKIADLDAKIREAEAGSPAPKPGQPPKPGSADYNEAKRQQEAAKQLLRTDPELSKQYKSGNGMIIGGSVAGGVGLLSLFVALGLANQITNGSLDPGQESRYRSTGIALAVVGLGGVVAGAVLIPIGVKRRKGAVSEARSRVALFPQLDGRSSGLAVRWSF